MYPHPRIAVLLCLAACASPALAFAQEDAAKLPPRTILEVPRFDRSRGLVVTAIEPEGTLHLEIREDQDLPLLTQAKGYYVLITGPETNPGPPRIVRARFDRAVPPRRLALTIGREAARRLALGDRCSMVRPQGATPAQMQALPDILAIGPKPAETPAALVDQRRNLSKLSLQEIGLAMANFQSVMGFYPPAVVFGPDGKPWHGWRVLLLPFLEQQKLFGQYDLSQPWDGPNNIKLLDRMPDVYRDPAQAGRKTQLTHYAALVGEWKGPGGATLHTAFPPSGLRMKSARVKEMSDLFRDGPGPGTSTEAEISDGLEMTLGVAPIADDRKIPWTKPEDLEVTADFPGLGKPGGIAAPYPTGPDLNGPRAAPVLTMFGSVTILLDTITPADLRALITRDGRKLPLANEPGDLERIPVLASRRPGSSVSLTLKIEIGGPKPRAWVERR